MFFTALSLTLVVLITGCASPSSAPAPRHKISLYAGPEVVRSWEVDGIAGSAGGMIWFDDKETGA